MSATGVPGVDPPHRPAVDEHRDEDQRLLLGRVGRSSCAPRAARTSSERTKSAFDAVDARARPAKAAALEVLRRPACRARAATGGRPASSASPNHTIALSTSELGAASRRAWLPSASHANGAGGSPGLGDGQLDQPARQRVDDDRVDRHHVRVAATRASCSATTVGRSSAAALTSSSTLRPGRSRWRRKNDDRVWTATRSRSSIDAEHLAARRDDREVAKAAVEHLEQRPRRRAGRARHVYAGRGHRGRHRRVARQTRGDHARAQVAIGEDPERPIADLDRRPRWRRPRSSAARPRGSACPDRRRPARRGSATPTGWWAGSRGGASTSRRRPAPPRSSSDRATKRSPAGARQQLAAPHRPRSGSRACPRPREPRSRSAGPTASTRDRTAHPRRAGRARGRRGRARPHRCARRAGARPARRPARRSSCRRGGTRPRAAAATRSTVVGVERVERRVRPQEATDLARRCQPLPRAAGCSVKLPAAIRSRCDPPHHGAIRQTPLLAESAPQPRARRAPGSACACRRRSSRCCRRSRRFR